MVKKVVQQRAGGKPAYRNPTWHYVCIYSLMSTFMFLPDNWLMWGPQRHGIEGLASMTMLLIRLWPGQSWPFSLSTSVKRKQRALIFCVGLIGLRNRLWSKTSPATVSACSFSASTQMEALPAFQLSGACKESPVRLQKVRKMQVCITPPESVSLGGDQGLASSGLDLTHVDGQAFLAGAMLAGRAASLSTHERTAVSSAACALKSR